MNDVIVLPVEITEIAKNVSDEKREAVATVLQEVFSGVAKARQQLDTIVVADENDKTSMKLANTIRLSVRQTRLTSEKILDAKREQVQKEMLSYKIEDQLWLKAKQIMQLLAKEVEELARYKEETAERIAVEKQSKLRTERSEIASPLIDFLPTGLDYGAMDQASFDMIIDGAKLQQQAKIEADAKAEAERIERDRLDEIEKTRFQTILPYRQFWACESYALRTMSDVDFDTIFSSIKKAKADYEAAQENIRLENDRLKKEKEAAERKAAEERKKAEDARRIAEEKARKEREVIERKAAEERRVAAQKQAALEAKLKAKADAEKAAAKAKVDAEKKAAMAPDREKVLLLIERINNLELPTVNSDKHIEIVRYVNKCLKAVVAATVVKLDEVEE